jgi:hypothetical protein
VFESGLARCWGQNPSGVLALGNAENIGDQPGEMPPAFTNIGAPVTNIETAVYAACAVSDIGELRCWGSNNRGRLGQGSETTLGDQPGEVPVAPIQVGGNVVDVGLGVAHTCARLDTGNVRCWGYGPDLGYGNTIDIADQPGEMPPPDVPLGGTVVELAVGASLTGVSHNCVLLDTGAVRCWGHNGSGQLGIGNTQRIGDAPGEMPPANTNVGPGVVIDLTCGDLATCAIFQNGDIRCWGANANGELGHPGTNLGDAPNEMPPPNTDFGGGTPIAMGMSTASGLLLQDGSVRMWGRYGGFGYPPGMANLGDDPGEMPTGNIPIGGSAVLYGHGPGAEHSCVVLDDWSVHCWGTGTSGALGYGNILTFGDHDGELPTPAVPTY